MVDTIQVKTIDRERGSWYQIGEIFIVKKETNQLYNNDNKYDRYEIYPYNGKLILIKNCIEILPKEKYPTLKRSYL